ncbi:MAG: hypothetical protein D3914_06845 [Candidatus Electrothrix sp. LOE2]|jgi:hypothetical protein|nr:hypothetical protein [Candidatus Electrothrix sp. LOE2]
MLHKKTIIGSLLFLSLVFAGQAFAGWTRTEIAYWGASGTAYCNNYDTVQIRVEKSYLHPNDAAAALWRQGAAACHYRGGLYDISGNTHCQWRPSW